MLKPTHIVLTVAQYQQLGATLVQLPYRTIAPVIQGLENLAVAYVEQDDKSLIRFVGGAEGGEGSSPADAAPAPSDA